MEAELQSLVQQAEAGQDSVSTWPELADFKAGFVGPNGSLTAASKGIAKLPNEEKPVFGKKINEVKQRLEKVFESIRERIEATELADKLGLLSIQRFLLQILSKARNIPSPRCAIEL